MWPNYLFWISNIPITDILCLFLGFFLYPQVRHVIQGCPVIIARSVHLRYYSGTGNNYGTPGTCSMVLVHQLQMFSTKMYVIIYAAKTFFFCQENCGSLTLSQMNKWLKNVGIIDGRKVQRVTQKRCMISKNVGDIDLAIRDLVYKWYRKWGKM